ncbi:hypothetical protein VIMS_03594 [Mycobacterium marinum]|uniref:hypothetical protein n=1 Tax=Mycobacterium marinum TaxID=1781 RepID=UPI000E3D4D95|nr:hypothetical protein [Mycobacterium marinum]RFZ10238.1 hypothetical protein VIMS_03594 [Mycobacterium marinum]
MAQLSSLGGTVASTDGVEKQPESDCNGAPIQDSEKPQGPLDNLKARYRADQDKRDEREQKFLEERNAGRALYSNGVGDPVLRDSVAAFIDELGFAERVSTLTDEDLQSDVERYDSVRLSLSHPGRYWDDYWRVVYFSDNVGVAMPIVDDDQDGGLSMVVGTVGEYQLKLAIGGRFVRGGITRGDLYADHSFITGEALVTAVLLEKNAIYPRIVLDQKCRDLAMMQIQQWAEVGAQFEIRRLDPQQLLIRDGENLTLSYLGLLLTEEDQPVEVFLALHRDWVRQKLEQYKGSEKLTAKYRWVADYHDFFVTQVMWFPQYRVGSNQEHQFASISFDWLDAPGVTSHRVPAEVLDRFEHECAKADIAFLTSSDHEEVTLDEAENESVVPAFFRGAAAGDRVLNSIRHSCELLSTDGDQDFVADIGPRIGQIVQDAQLIVAAAPDADYRLSGTSSERLMDLLSLLDKGLRILRTDHRANSVALQGLSRCARLLNVNVDPRSDEWVIPPTE